MNAIVGKPWLLTGGSRNRARPSFDQNFLTGSLGPGAVFARASTGTYYDSAGVLRSAAINTPRFDYDPVTLQIKGLLLEDASTNLLLQSGDMSNAAWAKSGVPLVVTGNNATAPDGTLTASRVVLPAVSSAPNFTLLNQSITTTAQVYTFSIWLRGLSGGEQTYLCVSGGPFVSAPRITLTTAWQRYTFITPTLTAAVQFFAVGNDLRDGAQTSTVGGTVFVWGAQVEALPYMSSHIPTTSVSVTRAADSLSYPIASVTGFNQTQGSLAHEYIVEGFVPGYNAPVQFVGANYNTEYIDVDEFTTSGATATTPALAGAVLAIAGAGTGGVYYNLDKVPSNVIHRGAHSWRNNALSFGAHDAMPAVLSTPTTAVPVIASLTISGPMHYQPPVSQWARRTRYWPRQLSQAELISATTLAGPTLSLDFMTPGTLDPRIVFTRASSATYTDANGVVQTAATNAPRWDYANGVLRGLLIEEQRTNMLPWSQDVSNGVWFKQGAVVVSNTVAAPDGTNTGQTISVALNGAGPAFYQQMAGVTGTRYEPSFWINRISTTGTLKVGNAVNSANGDWSVNMALLGTGWQRITRNHPAVTILVEFTGVTNQIGIFIYTTGATINASWWGFQLEQGAFPTSYIPTTSVSVARAQDNVSISSANMLPWYGSPGGSWLAEFIQNNPNSNNRIISVNGGALGETTGYSVSGGAAGYGQYDGSTIQNTTNSLSLGIVQKGVTTYAPSTGKTCLNAGPIASTAMTTGYGALLTYGVRLFASGAGGTTGYIRRVTYWNRALSDTELQQVTT